MDESAEEGKSPLLSKTIHFNWMSGVAIPAIWPFLPEKFRMHDYAIAAVTAWFTIGNVVLRFLTSEALIKWNSLSAKDVSPAPASGSGEMGSVSALSAPDKSTKGKNDANEN